MRQVSFALFVVVCISSMLFAGGPDHLKQPLAFSAEAKMKFVLVGDSTVTDDAGWGRGFSQWLSGGGEVINLARGGRSSGSFIAESRWAQALSLKPDYVLVQFGHNDEPGHGPERETDPATTFRANIARYVDDAIAAGVKPVLVTPLARRQWNERGRIDSSLQPYADAVKAVAGEKNVPVIDLHERSLDWYYSLGREAMVLIAPVKANGNLDGTHLNEVGGERIGAIVADELALNVRETDPYLNNWRRPVPTTTATSPSTAPVRPEMPKSEFAMSSSAKPQATATPFGARTIVVAQDGSGDFLTVQEAIDAAPANNADRTVIKIKPGMYYGCTVVPRA
jgi:pectinesterase